MPIERDTVIVVDIESTCWEKKQIPPNQRSEIIEIGICTYEIATGKIDNRRGILVKPIESDVSQYCTDLTHITIDMLTSEGISFESACEVLRAEYKSYNRLWLSWGNYDRRMFMEQCQRRNIDYPFTDNHCNLKGLFANIYGNRLGMKAALDKIKLNLQGTHHRGVDDAHNIARILHFMLETHGIDLLDSFWD